VAGYNAYCRVFRAEDESKEEKEQGAPCVCVCVCVRVRACACVWVRVCACVSHTNTHTHTHKIWVNSFYRVRSCNDSHFFQWTETLAPCCYFFFRWWNLQLLHLQLKHELILSGKYPPPPSQQTPPLHKITITLNLNSKQAKVCHGGHL